MKILQQNFHTLSRIHSSRAAFSCQPSTDIISEAVTQRTLSLTIIFSVLYLSIHFAMIIAIISFAILLARVAAQVIKNNSSAEFAKRVFSTPHCKQPEALRVFLISSEDLIYFVDIERDVQ